MKVLFDIETGEPYWVTDEEYKRHNEAINYAINKSRQLLRNLPLAGKVMVYGVTGHPDPNTVKEAFSHAGFTHAGFPPDLKETYFVRKFTNMSTIIPGFDPFAFDPTKEDSSPAAISIFRRDPDTDMFKILSAESIDRIDELLLKTYSTRQKDSWWLPPVPATPNNPYIDTHMEKTYADLSTFDKILLFGPDVHETAIKIGYWNEGESRNKARMVKLMICESSEAVEADRKDRWFSRKEVPEGFRFQPFDILNGIVKAQGKKQQRTLFIETYRTYVKDTVEAELASIALLVLDYCYGFGHRIVTREFRKPSTGTFDHDMLRLDWYIIQAYHDDTPGQDWGYVLAALVAIADQYKIDIISHIDWELQYFKTRPLHHNKKY